MPPEEFPSNDDVLADVPNTNEQPPVEPAQAAVTPVAAQAPAEPAPWQPPEYIMFGEEKVPWQKAQVWLGQGRHYSQRAAELNELQQRYQPFEGLDPNLINRFKEVNDFISSGEEGQKWWEHVNQNWNQRNVPPDLDPNLQQVVSPLNEQISQLSETVQSLLQERDQRSLEEQNKQLDADIKQIREKYSNIDFDAVDTSGLTLEQRVIQHANQNSIPSFRTAFLDYYHDDLVELARTDNRQQAASAEEKLQRSGVVSRSQQPQTGKAQQYDHRGKSYEDIHEDILQAYNIDN